MGQGRAVASATEALARNPGTRPGIMLFLVLGLAFIESLTLFTMVIIFVKM
jgi:F-type H+-transporting ATPase subunit c